MMILVDFIVLGIAAVLGLIPANIAKKKGRRFGLWWFYGWMLFIVALIHSCLISDENVQSIGSAGNGVSPYKTDTSVADELKKFKGLLDDEVISKEEYEAKKKQLLDL